MRVLVFGGTVFIGRAIVDELARAGHELCILHRGEHEPEDLPQAVHVHAPRMELGGVRDEIEAFGPEAVIDNIAISRAQVEVVLANLPRDLRYVVTSSMDVYKAYGALHAGRSTEPVPIDETSPVRDERYPYKGQIPGMDEYEKLDVEEAYLTRDATVLRLPAVYGEHDYQRREEFILRRVRAGRKRIPVGNGSWLWTRGYVGDVARGARLALESPDAAGEIFNLGESRTYPVGIWARMILAAAGSDAELVDVPAEVLPEDLSMTGSVSQHMLVDSSKARRMLGWTDTEHTEALGRSVAWHMANPPTQAPGDFADDDKALAAAG